MLLKESLTVYVTRGKESLEFIDEICQKVISYEKDVIGMLPIPLEWKIGSYTAAALFTTKLCNENAWIQNRIIGIKVRRESPKRLMQIKS